MAGTVVADKLEAASTSTLVIKNGVANTPPTVQDSAGTQIGTFCRAWVNFNGTGTVAIRASFNVSSITDNGTGDYTVNFTNALPDANYSVFGCAGQPAAANAMDVVGRNLDNSLQTTTQVRLYSLKVTTSTTSDNPNMSVSIFR